MKWRHCIRNCGRGLAVLLLSGLLLATTGGAAGSGVNTTDTPAWAAPAHMALKQVSQAGNAELEPTLLSNTDCFLEDYRRVSSSTMTTGCFTSVSFGQVDSDSDMVIFNGSDEAVPVLPYNTHQILVPWPQALNMLALQPGATGGAYLSMYKNPLSAMHDQRNAFGQLIGKQLVQPPDLVVRGPDGQQLLINTQTLAFSGGGAWLVAEDLAGSFVRINLATLDMTAFAPAYASQGSPALLQSQVTISDDGRFVAIANDAADSFRVYDLASCQGADSPNLAPRQCASYNYRPFLKQQIGGFQTVRHLRFMNNGTLSFTALSTVADKYGLYELAPTDSIHSLIDYLALGDSYTAGEGAFDYQTGTDTGDDVCHLSTHSYPVLLTRDLFSPLGGRSVACSGAVINDVSSSSGNYRGQVRGVASFDQLSQSDPALLTAVLTNFVPGYIAQQRFVSQYQPGIITTSVGGNDVGFGDILLRCVEPHVTRHLSDQTCFNTYEDRLELTNLIDRTIPRWTALYKQLQAKSAGSRLYVIGYPQIFSDQGNCGVNVLLSKSELEFSSELTDYLNSAIQQAASKAGVAYVDISHALDGHRLCEARGSDVAANGLTAGTDDGPLGSKIFGQESYHPNALGQALMEAAILKQTHNLAAPAASPPVTSGSTALLNAPKTGRVVSTRVPDSTISTRVIRSGGSTHLSISGQNDGLAPQTGYTVHLDGSNGPVIGSGASSDSGDLGITVTVPGGSEPGIHTIDVTGTNQAGEPILVTVPIFVPVSDSDADGDGITDTDDSCPGAINSGQDTDLDGIDDICDPLIANSTPTDSGNSGNNLTPTGSTGSASPPTTTNSLNTTPLATDAGITVNQSVGDPVAVFNSDEPTYTGVASATARGSLVAPAQVLGARTADPLKTLKQPKLLVRPASYARHNPETPVWPNLRTIHWLPWVILPIVLWLLLIVVGLGLQKLLKQQGQPGFT